MPSQQNSAPQQRTHEESLSGMEIDLPRQTDIPPSFPLAVPGKERKNVYSPEVDEYIIRRSIPAVTTLSDRSWASSCKAAYSQSFKRTHATEKVQR